MKLKLFIAYKSTSGKDIAENLYEEFKDDPKIEVFLDSKIPPGTPNQEEYRFTKIRESDYFNSYSRLGKQSST